MKRDVDRETGELLLFTAGRIEVGERELLVRGDLADNFRIVLEIVTARLLLVRVIGEVVSEAVGLAGRADDDLRLRVRQADDVNEVALIRRKGSVACIVLVILD